jgi:hypothetical protein
LNVTKGGFRAALFVYVSMRPLPGHSVSLVTGAAETMRVRVA